MRKKGIDFNELGYKRVKNHCKTGFREGVEPNSLLMPNTFEGGSKLCCIEKEV